MSHTTNALEYLAFSLLAAILLIILVIVPATNRQVPSSENIVVVIAFVASCILGISLTLRPNWLRNHRRYSTQNTGDLRTGSNRLFSGHHPDCPAFRSHTLKGNGRTWCAGCLGISIGLLLGAGLMIVYALSPFPLTPSLPWLIVGLLIIAAAYAEMFLRRRQPLLHIALNSLLGLGFALIVIVTLEHTGQDIYGLFALLLCFLLMDTRIQLSHWRHHQLCVACSEPCKIYG